MDDMGTGDLDLSDNPDAEQPDSAADAGDNIAPVEGPLPLCINEFVADNDASLNIDDAFPDWIELFNWTDSDVSLNGWLISDDRDEPDKHILEGDLVVPARSALVLYADNNPDSGPEHLDFSLSVESGDITLFSPDGRGSVIGYGPLIGDISAQRISDCCWEEDCWSYRFQGSPGGSNIEPEYVEKVLLPANSDWQVFDSGSMPGDGWTTPDYDDSSWWSGPGILGYGDEHIDTTINYGPDDSNKYTTTYYRSEFNIDTLDALEQISMGLVRDDGAAVYLNGTEVTRSNLPEGDLAYETLALTAMGDGDEYTYSSFIIDPLSLVEGTNTVAAEVHQAALTSSDHSFDLSVTGQLLAPSEESEWGPLEEIPDIRFEEIEGLSDPTEWLFSLDSIHEISIDLSTESYNALISAPYTYTPGSITIDGNRMEMVGVRLRGKYGSFREIWGKPKFKIDFNEYVEDQRFYGLEGLSLNNSVQDCGYANEIIGYRVFQELDLPAPRVAFTNLSLNGADYGLYQIVETEDEVFIDRRFDNGSGNLYDGKYKVQTGTLDWVGFADFENGSDEHFQLEEGTDESREDITAITTALRDYGNSAQFYEVLGALIDWEQFHRHIAAEQWSGHVDGYALNTNNYRVYFNPDDGLANFIPWDLDNGFIRDWEWGFDWNNPTGGIISDYCQNADNCWHEGQRNAASDMVTHLETVDLLEYFDEIITLIYDRTLTDPKRECSSDSVIAQQNDLRNWIINRNDEMRDFWGL
jgi:hypothetical protein